MVDDVSEQDFWPKLRKHILPRIKVMLLAERPNAESSLEYVWKMNLRQIWMGSSSRATECTDTKYFASTTQRTTYDVPRMWSTQTQCAAISCSSPICKATPNHVFINTSMPVFWAYTTSTLYILGRVCWITAITVWTFCG
jgi:hypothetical protein